MLENNRPLLVDRVTPVQQPSQRQVELWAHNQRIFISSTMVDLVEARETARKTITELGASPVMFENLGARSDDSRQAYLTEVRRCTIYLGILSRRYGARLASGYSATQEEYEEARRQRKELLIFLDSGVPTEERDGHLNQWLNELYQFHVIGKYREMSQLAELVVRSLTHLAGQQLTPWVKLDHLVFQATRITTSTSAEKREIEVTTACADPRIVGELSAAGQERFGQAIRRLTFRCESTAVQIAGVRQVIDPLAGNSLVLTCKAVDDRYGGVSSAASLNTIGSYQTGDRTYTRRDLVTIGLQAVALGLMPPQDPFLASTPATNFKALYAACGRDDAVFPMAAQLMIVERAISMDLVVMIPHVSVEPVRHGSVRISLQALLPQLYRNAEPEEVDIAGIVPLL